MWHEPVEMYSVLENLIFWLMRSTCCLNQKDIVWRNSLHEKESVSIADNIFISTPKITVVYKDTMDSNMKIVANGTMDQKIVKWFWT